MKKIILLMPLMAMTCFTNCGAKPEIDIWKIDLYKKSYQHNPKNIEQLTSITEYEYNDKDLLTKSVETFQHNKADRSKIVYECTYDDHEFFKTYSRTEYDWGGVINRYCSRFNSQYDDQGRMVHLITERKTKDDEWEVNSQVEIHYADKVDTIETKDSEGKLRNTTVITYDDHGWMTNIKSINYPDDENAMGTEVYFQLDEYGCAKEVITYALDDSYENGRQKITQETITYLDNLYYRPVKESIANYNSSEEVEYYSTIEREYDDKQRITLLKDYDGTGEATPTEYNTYVTYEY